MRHYYEYNGVVQATLIPMRRFVTEDEDIDVGVGCDREEADAVLTVNIERRIGAAHEPSMTPNVLS